MNNAKTNPEKRKKRVNYDKWGYIFIAPFFITYIIFSLFPLLTTFYNSFFENYMSGLRQIGPKFVGLKNFEAVLTNKEMLKYLWNTVIMWLIGFIPQLMISLLLAFWFSNQRQKVRGQRFFKTVIYMPNLIMAAAFSMLFFTLFSDGGPVNDIFLNAGVIAEPIRFLSATLTTRGLVGLMNFLMWFGNTTILLMAAMLAVDPTLYEAAECDGAASGQIFYRITMPLIKPIMIYVMITSMMGGIQMFDVPQILTNGEGVPDRTTMTLVMYLNKHLFSKNFGMSGAVSVILFIITAILSVIIFTTMKERRGEGGKA